MQRPPNIDYNTFLKKEVFSLRKSSMRFIWKLFWDIQRATCGRGIRPVDYGSRSIQYRGNVCISGNSRPGGEEWTSDLRQWLMDFLKAYLGVSISSCSHAYLVLQTIPLNRKNSFIMQHSCFSLEMLLLFTYLVVLLFVLSEKISFIEVRHTEVCDSLGTLYIFIYAFF